MQPILAEVVMVEDDVEVEGANVIEEVAAEEVVEVDFEVAEEVVVSVGVGD